MKPRHAAALALVGYVLVIPAPWRSPGTYPTAGDMKAPLRQWTIISTFPNEKECLAKGGDALANYRFKKEGMLLAPVSLSASGPTTRASRKNSAPVCCALTPAIRSRSVRQRLRHGRRDSIVGARVLGSMQRPRMPRPRPLAQNVPIHWLRFHRSASIRSSSALASSIRALTRVSPD
jgi:hypothetical protein